MYKIKFYGIGGQGVVTAAKILSHAVSIYEDRYAKTIPAFGHERRGAPVYTDIMIDDKPILPNCFVYEPDIVMVFAPSFLGHGIPIDKGIHKDSILVINCEDGTLPEQLKEKTLFKDIYYVNATQIALEEIKRDIPNSAMLGAFVATGIVQIDSIVRAVIENFAPGKGELNANAARKAFEKIQRK